jgi:hypothetical protein
MFNKKYVKYGMVLILLSMSIAAQSATVCTSLTRVTGLYPRDGGWIHVALQGITNGDISNCGNGGSLGLLLNFNDTVGSYDGKKMLFDILLDAKKSGERLQFCSTGCDTQHTNYSRLSHINNY